MSSILQLIPANYAIERKVLPLAADEQQVTVAVPADVGSDLLDELQFMLNKEIVSEEWQESDLLAEIRRRYQLQGGGSGSLDNRQDFHLIEREKKSGPEADIPEDHSIVPLVNKFISDAIQARASDIHVESYESLFRIRFRIDGKLVEYQQLPIGKRQTVVSRLKIMAELDIAEKRRPQDGRIRMRNGHKSVDIRVSTMPTDFGEKVVLRILDKTSLNHDLDALGLDDTLLSTLKMALQMPHGMVLVTGPTGSGKTTTLYSALNFLNRPDRNLITIEDPIEYNLTGINQTMVKSQIGLSFASLLRTILRQDPNIIMLGEIRDGETAEIAIQAALTGHMVLSTLHTNDAISTIVRLIDIGVEPFLIANSLKMVLAQRLIRRICQHCKRATAVDWGAIARYQLTNELHAKTFYAGDGCDTCHHTGFAGRQAIIEYLVIDDAFRDLILQRASLGAFRNLAREKKMKSLSDLGLEKAIEGNTALEEVLYETFVL